MNMRIAYNLNDSHYKLNKDLKHDSTSHTSFRVNPHSIVCLNVKERLARNRREI